MSTTLSIILAVYNEARHLKDVLNSLLSQEVHDIQLELLVIDGNSTDQSVEIATQFARQDARVRVFSNPQRSTPYAFNIGLQHANGQYVAILGAHALYAPDYIATCLKEMLAHNAAGCSGRIIAKPPRQSLQALLTYWAMNHPFGVSTRSFRSIPEGDADSLPYPVFRTSVLRDLGGYDVRMIRNQDNEMNYRIRQAGYHLWVTWKTHAIYYTKPTLEGLFRYAINNGSWCAVSFKNSPRSLGLRHYIPAIFFCVVGVSVLLALISLLLQWPVLITTIILLPLFLHLAVGVLASLFLCIRERNLCALFMPGVFLGFHLVYGYGFIANAILQEPFAKPDMSTA